MKNMTRWFRNNWIGEATLAGLQATMDDLDYAWGSDRKEPENSGLTNRADEVCQSAVKLAA